MKLVIIGAGPIGLEAAREGKARGFDVIVLERDRVGASLRRWGATRFFTPVSMNTTTRDDEAMLTGPEFADQVLEKIAAELDVREHHTVLSVARARMNKRDRKDHPLRHGRRFLLLVETPEGEETIEADVVFDASGATAPVHLGVPGERGAAAGLIRHLGELHAARAELAGQNILLVGNGHSSANALDVLAQIAQDHPDTRITWAVRTMNKRPVVSIADDPLPERAAMVDRANQLAMEPPPFLTMERKAHIEAIEKVEDRMSVKLSGGRAGVFDRVLLFVGYRPDLSVLSELQVQISPVTDGAWGIERALSNVTDCLNVPAIASDDLASGEPGFYLIGHKSYGRSSTFLLRDGIKQVKTILDALEARR